MYLLLFAELQKNYKKGLATNFIISNREDQIQKRVIGYIFPLPYMKTVNGILQKFKNIVKQTND